jgi:rRNA maturation RNase YbeY
MPEPLPSPRRVRGHFAIHSEIPRARVDRPFLIKTLRAGEKISGATFAAVQIVLIGDRKMAQLHRDFSGIPGTTDVLTFDLSENGTREGEVYVCLDQARRQARDYRVTLRDEVARLAVHGLLHLAGYRDKSARARDEMRTLEDAALARARKAR